MPQLIGLETKSLADHSCDLIRGSLDREENSIQFEFWSNFQQQGCGLLYAIDPAKPAKTQYMMQCEPLSEAQWYYYFTDANAWWAEQTRGAN